MSFLENKQIESTKFKKNKEYFSINSYKTNSTNDKSVKVKIVTFNGGVEIIDVESYKLYNQMGNNLKLEALEKNCVNECRVCNCTIL